MIPAKGDTEIVTLRRADRAADLWPAIEAAQYGRIVRREDGETPSASAPFDAFLAIFTEVVDAWQTTPDVQAVLIRRIDAGLAALRNAGYRAHWGVVHRTLELLDAAPVEMPIAIIRLGTRKDASVEIAVPWNLTADDD